MNSIRLKTYRKERIVCCEKLIGSINKVVCILVLVISFIVACSTNTTNNNAKIQFAADEHDFNTLQLKKEVEYSFDFSNPGESVLLIYDVKTSCGCTVAEWPKQPIKPKKTGSIIVNYDSEYPGMFHKEITVYYNGEDSPKVLRVKGQVEYPYPEENISTE
ncbi:MAG TPA: DUF1573 domain-containing protein [Draconibacterium sp.]|nr:DUF1573 domain-containing protein [Draconibacterium sp.]